MLLHFIFGTAAATASVSALAMQSWQRMGFQIKMLNVWMCREHLLLMHDTQDRKAWLSQDPPPLVDLWNSPDLSSDVGTNCIAIIAEVGNSASCTACKPASSLTCKPAALHAWLLYIRYIEHAVYDVMSATGMGTLMVLC